MKLKEKHNEFAVKCFVSFMKPSKVAEALKVTKYLHTHITASV